MLDINQAIVLLTQSDELAPEHREFVEALTLGVPEIRNGENLFDAAIDAQIAKEKS